MKSTFGIAKLSITISPTLLNEVRYQYGRDYEYEYSRSRGYARKQLDRLKLCGDPGRSPTCDLRLRSAPLYASELPGHLGLV